MQRYRLNCFCLFLKSFYYSQLIIHLITDCRNPTQSQDYYRALSESLAMADPLPRSQSPEIVVNSTIRYVRKQEPADEEECNQSNGDNADSGKRWYNVDVECLEGRRKTLELRMADEHVDLTTPMTDDEYLNHQKEMRNERLNHFFETAQFRNTPIQYISAMDQLKLLWAEEDEEKKAKESSKATAQLNNN